MADNNGQPTVLVRKEDGTEVHMTLDELQAMQAGQASDTQSDAAQTTPEPVQNTAPVASTLGFTQPQEPVADEPHEQQQAAMPELPPLMEEDEVSVFAPQQVAAPTVPEPKAPETVQEAVVENVVQPEPTAAPEAHAMPPAIETPHELATTTPVVDAFEDMAAAQVKERFVPDDSMKKELEKPVEDVSTPPPAPVPAPAPVVEPIQQETPEPADAPVVAPEPQPTPAPAETAVSDPEPEAAPEPEMEEDHWDDDDHASPLDLPSEELPDAPHEPVSPETDNRVQQVISACNDCVPKELLSRFEALVLSRIKGIRSDDQLRDYFARQDRDGGVGLSDADIDTVLKKIQEVYHLPLAAAAPSVMPKPKKPVRRMPVEQPMPNRSFGAKPMMHDVVAPKKAMQMNAVQKPKRTMGPVDVLAQFTLEELRRINAEGDALTEELRMKFETLKKESYLLYLDGRDAWYSSPLFQRYSNHTVQAVNNGKTLDAELKTDNADGGPMLMAEYMALANLHKQLHV